MLGKKNYNVSTVTFFLNSIISETPRNISYVNIIRGVGLHNNILIYNSKYD